MKIKTSELTGIALDWAVSKCEGISSAARPKVFAFKSGCRGEHRYSTDWVDGGPIIAREICALFRGRTLGGDVVWEANAQSNNEHVGYGPTPLIAAMRCCVASKLGDEVDVPEVLT